MYYAVKSSIAQGIGNCFSEGRAARSQSSIRTLYFSHILSFSIDSISLPNLVAGNRAFANTFAQRTYWRFEKWPFVSAHQRFVPRFLFLPWLCPHSLLA